LDYQTDLRKKAIERRDGSGLDKDRNIRNKMISTTYVLCVYSIVASIIILILSVLYHGCGLQPSIQDNAGLVDEKVEYEIGFINESVNNDECSCWPSLELTVLEVLVMGVLSIVGTGLLIKLMIHTRLWIMKKAAAVKQTKRTKAEKMRKSILEEYRAGFPVQSGVQEDLCIEQGKEELC
jgi:hypothetical protein